MRLKAQFTVPLDQLVKDIRAQHNIDASNIFRKLAIDLFTEIILKTPVDTGRARANWNLTINHPDVSTTTSTIPSSVTLTANQLKNLPTVYIANGLEYVRELEHGRSDQAPNGFIQLAIQKIQNTRF